MPCIEAVVTYRLEMFIGDMLDEKGNEIQYGNSFFHIGTILVSVIVASHVPAVIRINA